MALQIELRLASQEIHLQSKIGTPTLKEVSRDQLNPLPLILRPPQNQAKIDNAKMNWVRGVMPLSE
jgi:hypothetical protein